MRKGGPIGARSSVNRLWVSFRGTASLKGLIKDFKAHSFPMDSHFAAVSPHKTLLSILQHIPLMLQGCKVHVGFYETYKSIKDDVLGCVLQHLSLYPDTEVVCTGHSMGGACAVHCAVDLRVRLGPSHPLQVYTFGSPRVGNHKHARMYDLFVPETYRVVYNQDVVVTVPKFLFYYKHVGVEVHSASPRRS
jgi:predicted lipase